MEFKHLNNRFTLYDNEEEIGFLSYGIIDDIMYVNGVVVDPKFRGKGYAGIILAEAVKYVRSENLKVIPRCSYVVSKFDNGGYEDIDARS